MQTWATQENKQKTHGLGGRGPRANKGHLPNTSWNIKKIAFLASLNLCLASFNQTKAMQLSYYNISPQNIFIVISRRSKTKRTSNNRQSLDFIPSFRVWAFCRCARLLGRLSFMVWLQNNNLWFLTLVWTRVF